MPVKRSLTGKPKEDDSMIRKLLRAVETMGLGPGDLMNPMGSAVTRAGKLLKFPGGEATNVGDKLLREHALSPKLMNEFHLMEKVPTKPELPHDEVRRMLDLLDQKPKK